jgi:hypothetical protein
MEVSNSEVESYKARKERGFHRPMIVGCVVYLYHADQTFHDTGFMYLLRPVPARMPFELPDKKAIPANNFQLVPWVLGSGRIN